MIYGVLSGFCNLELLRILRLFWCLGTLGFFDAFWDFWEKWLYKMPNGIGILGSLNLITKWWCYHPKITARWRYSSTPHGLKRLGMGGTMFPVPGCFHANVPCSRLFFGQSSLFPAVLRAMFPVPGWIFSLLADKSWFDIIYTFLGTLSSNINCRNFNPLVIIF